MQELFWIKSLLYFFSLAVCLFLIGHLFQRTANRKFQFFRNFLLMKCISDLVNFLYFTTWISDAVPWLDRIHRMELGLQFFLGPLLFFFFNPFEGKIRSIKYIHFLPGILFWFAALFWKDQPYLLTSGGFLLAQFHLIVYSWLGLREVRTSENQLSTSTWSIFLVSLLIWKALRGFEYLSWEILDIITEPIAWMIYILAEAIAIFGFVFLFSRSIRKIQLFEPKNNGWTLPQKSMTELEQAITRLMKNEKIYLNPLINVQLVSKKLNIAPHHLSQFLNKHLKTSFNDLIVQYRIEESKKMLQENELTIQEVLYGVGFNSKSVFNTAFKRSTGMTPSAYRSSLKGKEIIN